MSSAPEERVVTCPACGGDSVYAPRNRWRPFCSERCKQQDLGAWASGSYAMPEREGQSDPDFEKS
ncbi:MAG: DNA gyrase inhibitor YacG [Hydrogenophaga sp.]|jgi:uncharacterized protein|uniref:DNA gyrase inhibitor YacG n=1 Tax=Hydrogenophaga crocea TaxID=2716225 RepID=A0A6G8IMN7_9BURK|nr:MULTISPECIES: DNA gyrase inhibitor YacG [Hydrogenophaga]MBL0943126.1 DNA gyrase inhibitor YacG [Hydrogenophaga sp.]QIM54472.1 DNA gyrase inhibitor YacG [Hydrogenophaga crocea]